MFIRTNRALLSVTILFAAAGGGAPALAQPPRINFDIHKTFSLAGVPNWATAEGRWFAHSWWKYDDASAGYEQWTPGQYPHDPPAQPASFFTWGTDKLVSGDPKNQCGPCIFCPPYPNCPPSSFGPVNLGSFPITSGGTYGTVSHGVWGGGVTSAGAAADFNVANYSGGAPFSGDMRVYGTYVPFWDVRACCGSASYAAYAYALGEFSANATLPPYSPAPATVYASVDMVLANIPTGGVPGTPVAPAPTSRVRVRDPIQVHLTDLASGITTDYTLMSVSADLTSEGSINWLGGGLNIDTPESEFHLVVDNPLGLQSGTFTVIIRDSVVVDSAATGQFAPLGAIPIGTHVPVWAPLSNNIVLNLNIPGSPNGTDLTVSMSNSGPEVIDPQQPSPCAADFDLDGLVTVRDIFADIAAWFAHDPRADVDGVPGFTVADIFGFLGRWFRGCH